MLPGEHASELSTLLRNPRIRVLILPYGSAFSIESWPAIRDFLATDGGPVALRGAPFYQPVRAGNRAEAWTLWVWRRRVSA
jgi:hypothetical protein